MLDFNRKKEGVYPQLGRIGGTLDKRATEVYENLTPQEQDAGQEILLSLFSLNTAGEGIEDNRTSVFKQASGPTVDYWLTKQKLKEANQIQINNFHKEQREPFPLAKLFEKPAINETIKFSQTIIIKYIGNLIILLIAIAIPTSIGSYFIVREIKLNSDHKVIIKCQDKETCSGRIKALERLVKANRSLKDYKLSRANLSGADLSGADLSGADLSNANLSGVNLSGADLSDANVSNADFSPVYLSGGELSPADLSGAKLSHANFSGVKLSNAKLFGTNLSSINLSGAKLSGAYLSNANLSSAYLFNADLSNADLSNADLSNADLSNADLSNADLSLAIFSRANLSFADLITVKNITSAQIKSACYWYKANYKHNWNKDKSEWVIDKKANQEFIEQLKEDQDFDLKEAPDCTKWERE